MAESWNDWDTALLEWWERGERWRPPSTDEETRQAELALANTNPLARPPFVMGLDNDISGETYRYIGAYGEEFRYAPLPSDVDRGPVKECFKNASLLVFDREDLTYVEGFATSDRTGGLAFLHAWAVGADGNVIDPTWPDGKTYFGVRYDREAYLKHLRKSSFYGVVAAKFEVAQKLMATGARRLRAKKEAL